MRIGLITYGLAGQKVDEGQSKHNEDRKHAEIKVEVERHKHWKLEDRVELSTNLLDGSEELDSDASSGERNVDIAWAPNSKLASEFEVIFTCGNCGSWSRIVQIWVIGLTR